MLKIFSFRTLTFLAFSLVYYGGCAKELRLIEDKDADKILKNGLRAGFEISYVQFCRQKPKTVKRCFRISSEECVNFATTSYERCLHNYKDYTERGNIFYPKVEDVNQHEIVKCFNTNFYNEIYGAGGRVLESCS